VVDKERPTLAPVILSNRPAEPFTNFINFVISGGSAIVPTCKKQAPTAPDRLWKLSRILTNSKFDAALNLWMQAGLAGGPPKGDGLMRNFLNPEANAPMTSD
jgi:hypothetical protein